MKKPRRDRHALEVSRSIAKTYQPKAQLPGKATKTVLHKVMRGRKKP